MRMVSIFLGSMPAAFMLAVILPAVGCHCPPVPLSQRTVLLPVLTTITVTGIETKSAGNPAFTIAALTSSTEALAMNGGLGGVSQEAAESGVTSAGPALEGTEALGGLGVFRAKAGETASRALSPSAAAMAVETTKSRRDRLSMGHLLEAGRKRRRG